MNKVPTKALHYITINGCRFETVLRYNPVTDHIGITTTRRGNYTSERTKRSVYARDRYMDNNGVREARLTSNKKWTDKNPEYMLKYLKTYRVENREAIRAHSRDYHEANKEHRHANNASWRKDNKEHLQQYRRDNPREKRDYVLSPPVCIKLNQWFPGSVGHHLTSGTLIYIPEEMNKGTLHNMRTGQGMYDINSQAINYLCGSI